MTEPPSRGAFARAAIAALCLLAIEGLAGAPSVCARERGLSHRADLTRGVVAGLVQVEAVALDVPVRLALAVARVESGLRMSMRGAAGERGAMQVLPQTARQVGVSGNLYGQAGIEAGVRYLKLAMAIHRRAGWCAVASAYNSGVWRRSHCTAYGRAVTLWRHCDDIPRRAEGL